MLTFRIFIYVQFILLYIYIYIANDYINITLKSVHKTQNIIYPNCDTIIAIAGH